MLALVLSQALLLVDVPIAGLALVGIRAGVAPDRAVELHPTRSTSWAPLQRVATVGCGCCRRPGLAYKAAADSAVDGLGYLVRRSSSWPGAGRPVRPLWGCCLG